MRNSDCTRVSSHDVSVHEKIIAKGFASAPKLALRICVKQHSDTVQSSLSIFGIASRVELYSMGIITNLALRTCVKQHSDTGQSKHFWDRIASRILFYRYYHFWSCFLSAVLFSTSPINCLTASGVAASPAHT